MNNDQQMLDVSQHDHSQQAAVEFIPRLNGSMLDKYKGAEISIVGKYLGNDNNDQLFEASDGDKFRVCIDIQEPWDGYKSKFIEIRGIVQNNGTVLQQSYQEWGDEFAVATWDKFVHLSHQYHNMF